MLNGALARAPESPAHSIEETTLPCCRLALVRGRLALVGKEPALLGEELALVGGEPALVGEEPALVGEELALMGEPARLDLAPRSLPGQDSLVTPESSRYPSGMPPKSNPLRGEALLEALRHLDASGKTGSFEDLAGELNKQKQLREQLFAQEMSSMKDRERLLEEKFNEALKRADTTSDTPFKNPLDLD